MCEPVKKGIGYQIKSSFSSKLSVINLTTIITILYLLLANGNHNQGKRHRKARDFETLCAAQKGEFQVCDEQTAGGQGRQAKPPRYQATENPCHLS